MGGVQRGSLVKADLIVPKNLHLGAQFAQILNQIVRK
jgi:hypothetical protein